MPDGIATAHFNAISGLDRYKDVRLLVVVGRTLPSVVEVEDTAGAITGIEVRKTLAPDNGGPRWYDKITRGLRMADGSGVAVGTDVHPDAVAEAVRWQVCEGELIQAVGRARGVNRTPGNPVDIELWNDVVLPLSIDEVADWNDVPSGREVDMLADGVVLDSPADMAACWPSVWVTDESARTWQGRRASGQGPIEWLPYRDLTGCSFRYRHVGKGQKWRFGWHDPAVVPHPRAWIEARLQARLAAFEFDAPSDRQAVTTGATPINDDVSRPTAAAVGFDAGPPPEASDR